jgi:hypothetical protein
MVPNKIVRASLGKFLRQPSAFPKIKNVKRRAAGALGLLPSLITQIPAFSVLRQGRRRESPEY